MSVLEKLLEGVQVEWKALDSVFDIFAGGDAPKDALSNFQTEEFAIPVLSNGISCKSLYGWTKTSKIKKPSLTISARGTIGWTSFQDKPFFPIVRLLVLTPKIEINLKYSYYFMKSIENSYKVSDAGIPQLTKPMIKDILIPIPPLEIQKEIVRILDSFTELTNELIIELTNELTSRKKQYSYYRDKMLSFDKRQVGWTTLGDIGKFTYGYAAKAQDSGDIRFVRITDINTDGKLIQNDSKYVNVTAENKKYILKKYDLLMARTGATFGKTMIFQEDYPAIYAGFLIKLSFDKNTIIPKFYWHFAQSQLFWQQANKLVSGGGQPQFNANALKRIEIPIPYPNNPEKSIKEQEKIVSILDKFDILTTAISEALPKEIKLRKKQYEYYRDMLLTFPKNDLMA